MKIETKVISSSRWAVRSLGLLLAAAALDGSQAGVDAGQQLPFQGSYTTEAQVTAWENPYTATIAILGRGYTSFLGATTAFTDNQQVDLAAGKGTATWILAGENGDSIVLQMDLNSTPTSQYSIDFAGNFTITGGSGRFAGATGSATFTGSFTFYSQNAGVGEFSLSGTISPPAWVEYEEIRANAGATFAMNPIANRTEIAALTGNGVAQVSRLGLCSAHVQAIVLLPTTPGGPSQLWQSTFTFTSTDGKTTLTAFATGTITPEPANPLFVRLHCQALFTGGTGQLTGAGGTGEIDGLVLGGTGMFTLKGHLALLARR